MAVLTLLAIALDLAWKRIRDRNVQTLRGA
jgi:hypothetical protein